MSDDSKASLAATLRGQIDQRIQEQHQLLAVAAAIAGAAGTFGVKDLETRPEILALLSLLFVGLSLALLRHEQEITIIGSYLVDEGAFGVEARAWRAWESHRYKTMFGTNAVTVVMTSAQAIGIYGVPVLAAIAFGWAALASSPTVLTWGVLVVAAILFLIFATGVVDVLRRYREVGTSTSG